MKMRDKLLTFFLFFVLIGLKGQSSDYVFQKEINQKAVVVTADILGNVYLSDGSVLYKYDNQLNLLFSYADFSMGKIHSIDATNPMKILIFSRNFMSIIFLNNKLAILNKYSLSSDLYFIQPANVCVSYDNGFWVYDEVKDCLFRFDANAKKVNESQVIATLIGEKVNSTAIQEIGGKYLVMSSPQSGFLIFDKYGSFIKRIPVMDVNHFSVWNDQLVFIQDNKIQVLNIETVNIISYTLPDPDAEQIVINGKQLIVLTSDGKVKIYGF